MRLVCLSIALALACPAAAQTKRPAKEAPPTVKKFDFDDDIVEAGATLPATELVRTVKGPVRPSLIKIRTTFVPEMIESARQR